MHISFDTESIRELCEDNAAAIKWLGPRFAHELQKRVADLRAATSVTDIAHFISKDSSNPHEVKINLHDGYNLVFTPNHNKVPHDDQGNIAWQEVYRIRLIEVSHD